MIKRTSILVALGLALTACAGTLVSGSRNVLPYVTADTASNGYRVVYRFRGGKDGFYPQGSLIDVNGTLYGTTLGGGSSNGCGGGGCGTIFAIDAAGQERVIYSFRGGKDGAYPNGNLLYRNGWLYGVTQSGGIGTKCAGLSCGTIFAVSLTGAERVMYRFPGGPSGGILYSGLAAVGDTLYGTTFYGGVNACPPGGACGTIFSVTTQGKYRLMYEFRGSRDGQLPYSQLVGDGRMLLGTTQFGGHSNTCCGTVFEVGLNGKERVIYRFKEGYADSSTPQGGLTAYRKSFFGTAELGGNTPSVHGCGDNGCGTIYRLTPAGSERIVYRFQGGADGISPLGQLTRDGGTFFGITGGGGSTLCGGQGCGTVFSITAFGRETVLYRFMSGRDGSRPTTGLLLRNGTLYGTTEIGGGKECRGVGCGTVFALPSGS